MPDLLIAHANIVDGTGKGAFPGHVLVSDSRIEAVIPRSHAGTLPRAQQRLDAGGLTLAPGFIDCHSHFDWTLPLPHHDQTLFPMVEQGVTTLVTGNCGFSPAPVNAKTRTALKEFSQFVMEDELDFDWQEMGEFLDRLNQGPGLMFNTAQLVGHGPLHLMAVGDLNRRPDPAQLNTLTSLARQALDQGALGISLGLMYPPGMFSDREELLALARVATEADKILAVHIKAFSRYSTGYPNIPFLGRPHNLKALEEILDIALETGVKLQISHFIFVGRSSWNTVDRAVELVEEARDKGARVRWDIYPHHCGNTYLSVFIPEWFMADLERHINNTWSLKRVKLELGLTAKLLGFDYRDIQIMDAHYPGGESLNGLRITDIARQRDCHPMDVILDIIRRSHGQALQLTHGYNGTEEQDEILAKLVPHEFTLFETDTVLKRRGFANPASYGAFPRILGQFVRDKKWLKLEEAVARMTGQTAQWFNIPHRGVLEPGAHADLVLFNAKTIADTTRPDKSDCRPTGIHRVFVNGQCTVADGIYQPDQKFGRALALLP